MTWFHKKSKKGSLLFPPPTTSLLGSRIEDVFIVVPCVTVHTCLVYVVVSTDNKSSQLKDTSYVYSYIKYVFYQVVQQQTAIITSSHQRNILKRYASVQHIIRKVNTIKMKFFLALATIGSAAAYSSSS